MSRYRPKPEPADGAWIMLADFIDAVAVHAFVNDDGIGFYGRDGQYDWDAPAIPSNILKGEIPDGYTHVAWFNK